MNLIKKYLGLVWMLVGPLVIIALLFAASENIDLAGKADYNKPLPWLIIISIFTPIAVGLSVFGWYAWMGEYTSPPGPLSKRPGEGEG